MTRLLLCIASSYLLPLASAAAQTDSAAITTVVDKLFDGMRTRDTAAMRALFVPEARMIGLTNQGTIRASTIDGWITSVGRANPANELRERTWDHRIHVDGSIAQAWMQYDLHVGDRFSHCGVDAFDLMKVGGEWKIISVMDTRRTTGCSAPPPNRRAP
jgi:hypothetical protein